MEKGKKIIESSLQKTMRGIYLFTANSHSASPKPCLTHSNTFTVTHTELLHTHRDTFMHTHHCGVYYIQLHHDLLMDHITMMDFALL